MAVSKISGLTEETAPVAADWLETEVAAGGTGKKVTIANLHVATLATTMSATTDTLAATDIGTLMLLSNAALVTVTVPLNASVALPVGFCVLLQSTGAGGATLTTTSLTLNGSSPFESVSQNEALFLEKTATDTWTITGGTAA
jgi:hypothetical protein